MTGKAAHNMSKFNPLKTAADVSVDQSLYIFPVIVYDTPDN